MESNGNIKLNHCQEKCILYPRERKSMNCMRFIKSQIVEAFQSSSYTVKTIADFIEFHYSRISQIITWHLTDGKRPTRDDTIPFDLSEPHFQVVQNRIDPGLSAGLVRLARRCPADPYGTNQRASNLNR